MTTRDSAQWYYSTFGMLTAPAPWMQKGPRVEGWNELEISTPEQFAQYFNGERQNLCILTGPGNLTDIDHDSLEAVWAWKEYELPTGMKWGHGRVTPTHFIYLPDEAPRTVQYDDPAAPEGAKARIIEVRCKSKDGKWLNTMAPPSTHPNGEKVEFVGSGSWPGKVNAKTLAEHARLTFVASLIARHARDGTCHQIFLALAGALRRADWPLDKAQRLVRAIYRAKWMQEAQLGDANKEVDSTYQRHDDGKDTTGLPTVRELLDERVFRRIKHELGLDYLEWEAPPQHAPPQQAPRPPRILPESEPIENLRHRVITKPRPLINGFILSPSITLLVAPGKVGKTVLAVQMAMSLANGLHLFDNYATCQAAGLIVEWDDQQGESSLQDFLLKSRASRPDQPLDIVLRPKDLVTISEPEFRPWLTAQIQKRPARFCVLDSLTALRGFGEDNPRKNVVKLEASEILMLGEVAIETNCAILLNHHDSKTAANLEMFSRAAGTFALQACSETQIVLGRFADLPMDHPARLLSVRGRHLEGLQTVIHFRQETLDYDFILDGPVAPLYPELERLLHAFRARAAFDAKQAKAETGWSPSKTYHVLSQLTRSGILQKQTATWNWNPSWARTLDQI